MRPGLAGRRSSSARPRRPTTPGAKFSRKTSACWARRRTISWPAGTERSTARSRLLAFTHTKPVERPRTALSQPRTTSPWPRRSILTTSAPISARTNEQYGIATACSRATTLIPRSGGDTDSLGLNVGEELLAGCVVALPDHHGTPIPDDEIALLVVAAGLNLDDPLRRARIRLPGLDDLALGVQRVAREKRVGERDL